MEKKLLILKKTLEEADFENGEVLIKRGKKNYNKIVLA